MRKERLQKGIEIAVILLFGAFTLVCDFLPISYVKDELQNRLLAKSVQQLCGAAVAIWLTVKLNMRIFGKVENWLYLLPCLVIAVDNFPFFAYFQDKTAFVRTGAVDIALFALSCFTTGLFEELVFRGILFNLLAGCFSGDKRGLWTSYVLSSVVFGVAHLLNGFSLATLLQVGYTILTGGLFAFCFLKTKNILCPAFVHGLYNFCGLLLDTQGLGTGVVFDLGTTLTMLFVSVLVGVFVLYNVWIYPEEERVELYKRLNIITKEKE